MAVTYRVDMVRCGSCKEIAWEQVVAADSVRCAACGHLWKGW